MNPEFLFFWTAVIFYGISTLCYIIGLVSRKEKFFSVGALLAFIGVIPHIASVALRWIEGGVLPFIEVSESITAGVMVAMIVFLIVQSSVKRIKAIGIFILPVNFILLSWAGTLMKEISGQLPASLQSYWLWVHIIAASTGFSLVLIAAGMGLLFLLKEKYSKGFYEKLPELSRLDDLSYRYVAGGFIMLGVMIISGAFWSNQVKGSYWNWDSVEVWSLVCWLVYGIYLHLRITIGWRNRKLAWYALLSLLVMVVSYWGIPFVAENFHTGFRIEH
ncbi:MAG: cytochrome c biogenesis protein CcsA [Nitrospiraceae bacterium]|nr:MAG: cytochrome c biogenesis protein CcsA [Nitrospiraceae bacterium]